MTTISYDKLIDFGVNLLTKIGFDQDDAQFMAETAVTTEAAGVHTHGVVIFAGLHAGNGTDFEISAKPEITKERGSTALIDGHRAAGGVCARLAVKLGREKARENGSAVISVRNTSWIGGLGAYLLPLAREGFFAQLLAQSSACLDAVPVGGLDACFSTNPIALAFPTHADPVVGDFSTAAMSMGKAKTLANAGKTALQPVFFTQKGELTDDPNALLGGGSMLTAGGDLDGHKGYILSLWIEALTAMAGGNCNNPDLEQRQSFTLMVIDPEAFADGDWYTGEMKRCLTRIKSGRTRPGVEEIRIPGERMQRQIADSMRTGVEIPDDLFNNLNNIAKGIGMAGLESIK